MAGKEYKDMLKRIRDGDFERVYYLHGDEDFLKEDAIQRLIARAVDPGTRDFNLDVRRAAEIDTETLTALLATPPMMAERRVVVLRDVSAMRKEVRKVLDGLLKSPAPDTVLVLTETAGTKPDRKLAAASFAVAIAPPSERDLLRWITKHSKQVHGATIDQPAAELLVKAVGSDLYELASELDKLASYCGERTIDVDAVSAVVGVRAGETLEDLLDHIAERDAARALALVRPVLSTTQGSGKKRSRATGVSIVMALAVQMLAIGWGRARVDAGMPRGRLTGAYMGLLKETAAWPFRSWTSAAECWANAVPRWDAAGCARAVALLLETDVTLKSGRVSKDDEVIESLVLALCVPARQAAA